MMINNNVAIKSGLALTTPNSRDFDADALRKKLETQRPLLIKMLNGRMRALYAYIYRSLSDDELERFLVFSESGVGRKYHAAAIVAMDRIFSDASLGIGFELGGQKLGAEPKARN